MVLFLPCLFYSGNSHNFYLYNSDFNIKNTIQTVQVAKHQCRSLTMLL